MKVLRRGRRRGERGSVVVETAFSLVILAFIAIGAITLGDVMVTRQKMSAQTSSIARFCSMLPFDQVEACVNQRAQVQLLPSLQRRCANAGIETATQPVNGVWRVQVTARCVYNYAVISGMLDAEGIQRRPIQASTTMPLQQQP